MVNTRAKGNKAERGARDIYEALGYDVDRVGSTAGGHRMTDAFGEVDIIALHPERRIRFAQVKTEGGGVRAFVEWAHAALPEEHAVGDFLARHAGTNQHDPPKWRLQQVHVDGERVTYRTVVDERKEGVPAEGQGVRAFIRGDA